jgi:hypothetical protein
MTIEIPMTKPQTHRASLPLRGDSSFVLRHSFVIQPFVIGHLPPALAVMLPAD